MARYRDGLPGFDETQPRIYVKFRPQGAGASFLALLDTGAHFCILNEDIADLLRDSLGESLGQFAVRTAYGVLRGNLYSHRIKLIAEVGESLDVVMTVFLPPEWRGPCFLGYAGALERTRFAIDPRDNWFQFASL